MTVVKKINSLSFFNGFTPSVNTATDSLIARNNQGRIADIYTLPYYPQKTKTAGGNILEQDIYHWLFYSVPSDAFVTLVDTLPAQFQCNIDNITNNQLTLQGTNLLVSSSGQNVSATSVLVKGTANIYHLGNGTWRVNGIISDPVTTSSF